MASPKRDNEKAARVLAEWAVSHFREAKIPELSLNYEVHESTIWRWRGQLASDQKLRLLYEQRLNDLLNQAWKTELGETLTAGIRRMKELINISESLTAVTDAVSTLVDIELTAEALKKETDVINSGTGTGATKAGQAHVNGSAQTPFSTAN